jgi:hypothetical protein
LAQSDEYLRFTLGGVPYLLASSASCAIEKRDALTLNTTGKGKVAAWSLQGNDRWPAYCFDRELRVSLRDNWERAIFLEARPLPVGVAADSVQLLGQGEAVVSAFTPLGPAPTRAGHLFTGAWVVGPQAILVFDAATLAAFLQGLGG